MRSALGGERAAAGGGTTRAAATSAAGGERALSAGQAHRVQGGAAHVLVAREIPKTLPGLAATGAILQSFR